MRTTDWKSLQRETKDGGVALVKELDSGGAVLVRGFLADNEVALLRERLFSFRDSCDPQWQPLVDNCPDYHRIVDENPHSRVRGKFRVFHFHRWNERRDWFEPFRRIFELKCRLANHSVDKFWGNVPSQIVVPRLTINHYPSGGGFLSEHVDPHSDFARIQTLVALSDWGRDFRAGGIFYRGRSGTMSPEAKVTAGDLLMLSPVIPHWVAPVDPNVTTVDWNSPRGRIVAIPILVHSDVVTDESLRSRMVKTKTENIEMAPPPRD